MDPLTRSKEHWQGGRSLRKKGSSSPGCVEDSREQQLVVYGDAHVAWLVEG